MQDKKQYLSGCEEVATLTEELNNHANKTDEDEKTESSNEVRQARTSIIMPESLLRMCEDTALANKRSGNNPKNVSAIIRAALELYFSRSTE